jgi:hypothetical protein
MSVKRSLVALGVTLLFPVFLQAQSMDFEGLKNNEQILEFYNGGTGSMGSSGSNIGVSFGMGALALIDADDGGTGNFENNPSGSTVAFWLSGSGLNMNVANGFTGGFSFFYSSSTAATVNVWSGLNATGNLMAAINLGANWNTDCLPYGPGRTGSYCNWDPIGVAFAGTAMSVDFGGTADQTGYDNITFAATPVGVPEPGSLALLFSGIVGIGFVRGRRREN